MSVNTLGIEQAYQLMAAIHNQATGKAAVTPTDLSSFVSVATTTLSTGYENTLNAISIVLNRTLYAVREYDGDFNGLEMDAIRWGGITRKISFGDTAPEADGTYALVNGVGSNQYEVKKVPVIETHYYGSLVFSDHVTIYTRQLDAAFRDPAEFSRFISSLLLHWANVRKQWLDSQKHAIVNNFIAGKNALNSDVIHLLTEYNSATGLSLTATTVMQPANYPAFMKWVYARIQGISRLMTKRSDLFQEPITGIDINRHTPVRDQRFYIMADFLEAMTARVQADTYHDSFIRYADVEPVSYWQAIDNPDAIQITPVYIDSAGAVVTGTAQTMSKVIGIIFDRDAMGLNIQQDELVNSPYQARDQYYNIWYHFKGQWMNDFTEKAVVLMLD